MSKKHVSTVTCHLSPVTCHLSPTPTATASDTPLITPPIYTVDWLTKTENKKSKIKKMAQTFKKGFLVLKFYQYAFQPEVFSSLFWSPMEGTLMTHKCTL